MLSVLTCTFFTIALIFAESRQSSWWKAIFKCGASTSFLIFALQCSALSSVYGRLILVALALSWIGDMLLLSQRSKFFLTGIAAFLLAHLAFAFSFASLPLDATSLALALVVMAVLGFITLRWLWFHLTGFYRFAVSLYVSAIALMCALAISASIASGVYLYALGALIFAVSDISVARDRFVKQDIFNRVWGLPLYYAAQLMLAWTITFQELV